QTGPESRAVVDEKIPYAASTSGSPSPRVISPPTEPPDLRLAPALAPVPPRVRGVPAARSGRGGWRMLDPAHRRRHARRGPPAGHGPGARGRARAPRDRDVPPADRGR